MDPNEFDDLSPSEKLELDRWHDQMNAEGSADADAAAYGEG